MRKRQRERDREREIRGRTYIPLICFLVTTGRQVQVKRWAERTELEMT